MIDRLPTTERQEVGYEIGKSIHGVLTSQFTAACLEHCAESPAAEVYAKAAGLYQLTGEAKWKLDPLSWPDESSLTHVVSRQEFRKDACDLLCEAFDDSFYWFDKIRTMENPNPDVGDLVNHPVFPSAISLQDKVHRTVKVVYDQLAEHNLQLRVPTTRTEFMDIYTAAPELLRQFGMTLEVDHGERDPLKRGFCPANGKEGALDIAWYKDVLQVLAPFYLKLQDRL